MKNYGTETRPGKLAKIKKSAKFKAAVAEMQAVKKRIALAPYGDMKKLTEMQSNLMAAFKKRWPKCSKTVNL